jgi:hypothetical protein
MNRKNTDESGKKRKRNHDKDRYELLRVRISALEKDVAKIKEQLKMQDPDYLKFEVETLSYQDSTGDGV